MNTQLPADFDRSRHPWPGVGRLHCQPADRDRGLSGAADRKAHPGRRPGRRRQDRAGQGAGRLARAEADPPAVLRGPRRGQGAVRMEIRQAAALHPDPEGQARRSAGGADDAGRGARQAARFRRRVLLQGIRRAAAAAAGAGAGRRLRAADRRDRQVGRRVRIVPAGNPLRLPGLDPGARHRHGDRTADGDPDLATASAISATR